MDPPPEIEHRLAGYHFDSDSGEHQARCSCGWVSDRFTDPAVAGAVWDGHVGDGPRDFGAIEDGRRR